MTKDVELLQIKQVKENLPDVAVLLNGQRYARRSMGHECTVDGVEYYGVLGDIYSAPIANPIDVNTGCRIGRFYCTKAAWPYSPVARSLAVA